MAHEFRKASRTAEQLKTNREVLDEVFSRVASNGKINKHELKALNDKRIEVAELLVTVIQDQMISTDPTPMLVDRASSGFGDKTLYQEMRSNLAVVNRAYGTKPLSQRLTALEYNFTTSMKEVAVEVPLEEIAAGRITASQVADAIAFATNRYKVKLVLDAIDSAVTAVADRTGVAGYTLRYSGLTRGNLEKAIDGLADEGTMPTVFGRHIALYPDIRNFTPAWTPDVLRDMELRGQAGMIFGAPVVSMIDQFSKLVGGKVLPSNRVYLASQAKGGVLMEKDVSFLNWAEIDERTAVMTTGIRLEDGVFIHDAHKYRVIEKA